MGLREPAQRPEGQPQREPHNVPNMLPLPGDLTPGPVTSDQAWPVHPALPPLPRFCIQVLLPRRGRGKHGPPRSEGPGASTDTTLPSGQPWTVSASPRPWVSSCLLGPAPGTAQEKGELEATRTSPGAVVADVQGGSSSVATAPLGGQTKTRGLCGLGQPGAQGLRRGPSARGLPQKSPSDTHQWEARNVPCSPHEPRHPQ